MYTVSGAQPTVLYRVFHRTVQADPPTADDFLSNRAKGQPQRNAEKFNPALWDGISVMDTLDRAQKRAREFPQHGAFIAVLRIPPDARITATRTLRTPGHYTLHGAPADLLACVAEVIAVEPVKETGP